MDEGKEKVKNNLVSKIGWYIRRYGTKCVKRNKFIKFKHRNSDQKSVDGDIGLEEDALSSSQMFGKGMRPNVEVRKWILIPSRHRERERLKG